MLSAARNEEDVALLAERVANLEKQLASWQQTWVNGSCRVEQLVIEKLTTDKLEINLPALNISELSGILNIGQSYDSTIVRQAPSKEAHRKEPPLRKPVKPQFSPRIKINYVTTAAQATAQ